MARKSLVPQDMGGNAITNLPTTPSGANDAASKAYVDAEVASVSGGGLTTPGTTTDNALLRWDGTTGTAVQDSAILVSDTGSLSSVQHIVPQGDDSYNLGAFGSQWGVVFAGGVESYVGDLYLYSNSGNIDLDGTNIINPGNIDGRDLSVDGAKLDGIESGAQVNTVTATNTVSFTNKDTTDSTNTVPFRRVIHGSTASTARPNATHVEWVGSVAPTNANTTNDTWIDTA